MSFDRSMDFYKRAECISGRSMTRSKAPGRFFAVGEGPLYALKGQGAFITDLDGNEYLDMLCALGAVSLGYRHPVTKLAGRVAHELCEGVMSLPSGLEIQAAESMLTYVAPWATSCRFTRTGSEALHAAYRIAKAATKRNNVLIGDWAYHGWHEWAQDKHATGVLRYAHNAPMEEFDTIKFAGIAAILVEPHRWEKVNVDWLRELREYCTANGILLIFDEMIYGGRWALGGATAWFGVQPDIACFGKAIGNGAAVACIVGQRDILDAHSEMVSGTYSGDVFGLASVIYTIKEYKTADVISKMWENGIHLAEGLDDMIIQHRRTDVHREGSPVHQRLRFDDPAKGKLFSAEMAKNGVLWHPEVVNVSAAHTRVHINMALTAAEKSLKEV